MIAWLLVLVPIAAVIALAVRKPALTRIAWREATGHRAHSLVLIGGLMVGSAALTASLAAVDSAQRLTRSIELLRWGSTDVTVTAQRPFPIELADLVGADPEVREATKAVVPQMQLNATLASVTSRRTESLGTLIGFDAERDAPLGQYGLVDGTHVGNVGPRDILLNERAATRLGAQTGDTIQVSVGATGEQVSLAVRGIARMRGKAAWGLDATGFVRLAVAQKLAQAPGDVNVLRVVSEGDSRASVVALDDAMAHAGLPLRARDAKREGLASAQAQTRFLRYALVAMAAFTLIAGLVLIVNLVVMLAEDRQRQLGMLRALGMRRSALVAIGAIEGSIYSVAAGALGALTGLGIGALLAGFLQNSFQSTFLPGGSPLPFLFRPSAGAAAVGFSAGTLVSLAAIALAWRRAGGLNVSAAIRGLTGALPAGRLKPAAASTARLGAALLAGAMLASSDGRLKGAGGVIVLGIVLSAFARHVHARVRYSVLGLAVAGWALASAGTADLSEPRSFMQFFVALNVVLVFALSVIVATNLGALERAAALLGRKSAAARQSLRPVLAYLAGRPLRTGLTIGIFALVLSLVTAAATVLSTDRPRYEEDASGFQVLATTMGTNEIDLAQSPDVAAVRPLRFKIYRGALSFGGGRIPQITMAVYEATPALASLPLASRDPRFASDREAWQQVLRGDRSIGVFGNAGERLRFDATGTNVVNAGFLRAGRLLLGTVVGPRLFAEITGDEGRAYLVKPRAGTSPQALARSLEARGFADGLDASTTRSLVEPGSEDLRAFLAIVSFMARVALALGIISLAIIGLRAAVERRRMLGTLRMLGYRRRTVLVAVLVESLIVTTAGALVGAGGGLLLNRFFFQEGFGGIDLGLLGGTLLATYLAAMIASAGPAVRAARMSPAEAVRIVD